jgi:SagB-type dehydrogenase family enzyme
VQYHDRSTHHPHRFAPGPGHLDWANQPEPFRTYAGAPILALPLASADLAASWEDLHRPGAVAAQPLDRASLGAFFELALGLTAWKEHAGSRWALRANPSSGNLHPTEGYALLPEAPGVAAGLYHYLSRDHVLERRFTPSPPAAARIAQRLPAGAFLAGLTSIHWREAWKYGERAFRYCQHDVGHAVAGVRYAAAVLGWSARLLDRPGDADVAALLGLDRADGLDPQDREHPDALLVVAPAGALEDRVRSVQSELDALLAAVRDGEWVGRPNALSPEHVAWPAIDAVASAAAKPRTSPAPAPDAAPAGTDAGETPKTETADRAVDLIRRRRSAIDMDGASEMGADVFRHVLERLSARPDVPPFDALPWPPRVHLLLFVHRVSGLARGLYLLARSDDAAGVLRGALRPTFGWTRPAACPPSLPLFLLEEGDARSAARLASCGQSIASESAFSLGMLAVFEESLREGPWWYRRLFWECGALGQALYMEAEAAGFRGTGIGCFFDDVVHDLAGVGDRRVRDLYHFAVGGAVDDPRLATRPAYPQEVRARGVAP